MIKINIALDFSDTPGPRYSKDGEYSGEEFRESILKEKFSEALKLKEKLEINLDGGYGYPTSFLEESFGGLARQFGIDAVLNTLEFVSTEEPSLINKIIDYIKKANQK